MFIAPNSDRKKDQIYAFVLERLLTARYRFGDSIVVKELMAETGISKQPIMAALNELRAQGFVEINAQVGCEVVQPRPFEIADFYRMFARFEGLMAELAAARHVNTDIIKLREINDRIRRLEDESGSPHVYRRMNREFHTALHAAARSQSLHQMQLKNFALSDFWIGQSDGFTTVLHHAVHEHDVIIAAIESADPVAACSAAEYHISVVARDVMRILSP